MRRPWYVVLASVALAASAAFAALLGLAMWSAGSGLASEASDAPWWGAAGLAVAAAAALAAVLVWRRGSPAPRSAADRVD